jgi:hypothetical protein
MVKILKITVDHQQLDKESIGMVQVEIRNSNFMSLLVGTTRNGNFGPRPSTVFL